MANSTSGDSVIARVSRLIGAFDVSTSELTVAALARQADLPQTTAYRMIDELVLEGIMQRTPDGRIQLGTKLWEMVSRSSPMLGLREAALPYMEDVQSIIGHHTALGVLDGFDVLYIERLGARSSTINIAKVAQRLPLHGASSGMVLLAHAPAAFQEQALSRKLESFTDTTVTDPEQLRRQLAEVRAQGYAVRAGIIVRQSSGIAVPVFGAGGSVVAALSVIVPVDIQDTQPWVQVLMAAARGISRSLGWKPEGQHAVRRSIARP